MYAGELQNVTLELSNKSEVVVKVYSLSSCKFNFTTILTVKLSAKYRDQQIKKLNIKIQNIISEVYKKQDLNAFLLVSMKLWKSHCS